MTARNRVATALGVVALAALAGCAGLPSLEGRTATSAMTDTEATRLGRAIAPAVNANPGRSGTYALAVATDGFAARAVLANAAQSSIDAQYYDWHDDQTGDLLFEALWKAAGRGVRVRLLLDDANTAGREETIAALDAHTNIEVRLYNPFVLRDARLANFVTDFTRLNHRMHNKSFTVDSQVTIVGGRNIGNEYFGAESEVAFKDLEVIAVGPVVREVSAEFDLYWNSPSAYPAALLLQPAASDAAARLEARFANVRNDPASAAYINAVRDTPVLDQIVERRLPIEWTRVELVYDDPAKTLDATPKREDLLLDELLRVMGTPQRSLDLISPYFVPGDRGTAALESMARAGVRVRVLTNSLAATDVPPVHAGYAKRRCTLLRAGVKLYELKASAPLGVAKATRVTGSGSSGTSMLHAKTFEVDGRRAFVGSFNFDPRSALLNTEMGLIIDSPKLATGISSTFDSRIPDLSYEVRVGPDGQCPVWIERTPEGEVLHDTEPGTSASQRAWIEFLGVLPIEWLL